MAALVSNAVVAIPTSAAKQTDANTSAHKDTRSLHVETHAHEDTRTQRYTQR